MLSTNPREKLNALVTYQHKVSRDSRRPSAKDKLRHRTVRVISNIYKGELMKYDAGGPLLSGLLLQVSEGFL